MGFKPTSDPHRFRTVPNLTSTECVHFLLCSLPLLTVWTSTFLLAGIKKKPVWSFLFCIKFTHVDSIGK